MDLWGEGRTGLWGEREVIGPAEGLNLDFTCSPTGPHQFCMNLNSELLSIPSGQSQGRTLSHQHPGRSDTAEQWVQWVFAKGTGEGTCGWHRAWLWYFHCCLMRPSEPRLPRVVPAGLIYACFTVVLIKSPWSSGACVRSSHQKSKQCPGVADSLIM